MILKEDNINSLPTKHERDLAKALLKDLEELNKELPKQLSIEWQDYHNEYSAERTDPCPDYYGMYKIIYDGGEMVGMEMDIDELDTTMCALSEFKGIMNGGEAN